MKSRKQTKFSSLNEETSVVIIFMWKCDFECISKIIKVYENGLGWCTKGPLPT